MITKVLVWSSTQTPNLLELSGLYNVLVLIGIVVPSTKAPPTSLRMSQSRRHVRRQSPPTLATKNLLIVLPTHKKDVAD